MLRWSIMSYCGSSRRSRGNLLWIIRSHPSKLISSMRTLFSIGRLDIRRLSTIGGWSLWELYREILRKTGRIIQLEHRMLAITLALSARNISMSRYFSDDKQLLTILKLLRTKTCFKFLIKSTTPSLPWNKTWMKTQTTSRKCRHQSSWAQWRGGICKKCWVPKLLSVSCYTISWNLSSRKLAI